VTPTLHTRKSLRFFQTLCLFLSLLLAQFPTPLATAQNGRQERVLTHSEITKLPAREKRWALIIGVDKYEDENITPLRGATNDANALAGALERYAGFDRDRIILLTNDQPKSKRPTRVNILRHLSNLKGLVPGDGLLFIAFSGHGIERDGRAFLIPSDAVFTDDIELLKQTAVGVDSMKKGVRETGVGQVLILLDACRNDPVSGKADSVNPLTETYLRDFDFDVRNREVSAFATLYATSVGARAYEDADKREGYFMSAVVEALSGRAADPETGEVTLRGLLKYVEETVPTRVAVNLGRSKRQKPFAVIEGYKADELVLAIGGRPAPQTSANSKTGKVLVLYDTCGKESEQILSTGLQKEFTALLSALLNDSSLVVADSNVLSETERKRIDWFFTTNAEWNEYGLRWLPYAVIITVGICVSDQEKPAGASQYMAEAYPRGVGFQSTEDVKRASNYSYVGEPNIGYGTTKEQARRNAVLSIAPDLPAVLFEEVIAIAKRP